MVQVVAVVSGQSEYTEAVGDGCQGPVTMGGGGGGGAEATAATGEASPSASSRL